MEKVSIIMVEDDDDDYFLLQSAFDETNTQIDIIRARGFEELATMLERFEHIDRFILLVDFNLPRINGLECLRNLKGDERFKCIPVLIFTTCAYEEAIRQAFANGAVHFITKPPSFEKWKSIALRLGSFQVDEMRRPTPWREFVLLF